MQYLDKKNSDGSPLEITAAKWADRISIHCLEKTMETNYDSLISLVLMVIVIWIFSYIRSKK